jgi:hypothetical protein
VLGAVAYLPELQFLDKNSKFKSAGRTYKAFKLLGRATKVDPLTGVTTVLAQVESETFKVRLCARLLYCCSSHTAQAGRHVTWTHAPAFVDALV